MLLAAKGLELDSLLSFVLLNVYLTWLHIIQMCNQCWCEHLYLQLILQFHCFPLEGQLLLQTTVWMSDRLLSAQVYPLFLTHWCMICWICRALGMQPVSGLMFYHTIQSHTYSLCREYINLHSFTVWEQKIFTPQRIYSWTECAGIQLLWWSAICTAYNCIYFVCC